MINYLKFRSQQFKQIAKREQKIREKQFKQLQYQLKLWQNSEDADHSAKKSASAQENNVLNVQ